MAEAMVVMLRGGLLPQAGQLPALQAVRYGSKAVTRHRRVMHFQRQKVMAVTDYIPQTPAVTPTCLPSPPGPHRRLLRQEVAAVFQDNPMIAACQKVALSAEDKLLMPHQLRKRKILMKDSKCQNLLPLFHQPLQLTTLLDQYIRQQREKDSVVSTNGKPDPPDPPGLHCPYYYQHFGQGHSTSL
uniref:Large ribosomal subunit protein uL10m n=1 Tax=Piliocolobus tephrosceles TaxID=591936 RepID=A0A8C9IU54_9PRIM